MEKQNNVRLKCKDFTVSNEIFELLYDSEYDMLVTTPRPSENELGKYYESSEYISHTDSKRSLMDKVYQFVKNYTLKQKLSLIDSFATETRTILDIGCGTGDFLQTCLKGGWKVQGVEPSEKARTTALNKLGYHKQEKSIKPVESNIDQLLHHKMKFDVITMWHVLEHVPDLQKQIAQLKTLIKPGGMIVIAVPNYKSYDAQYYGEFWAAYDVPRHLWHFSKTSIKKLFKEKGFVLKKILPMKFDSFYVSMLSEKYKNGKPNLVSAFLTGLRSNLKAKKNMEYSSLIYLLKNTK